MPRAAAHFLGFEDAAAGASPHKNPNVLETFGGLPLLGCDVCCLSEEEMR